MNTPFGEQGFEMSNPNSELGIASPALSKPFTDPLADVSIPCDRPCTGDSEGVVSFVMPYPSYLSSSPPIRTTSVIDLDEAVDSIVWPSYRPPSHVFKPPPMINLEEEDDSIATGASVVGQEVEDGRPPEFKGRFLGGRDGLRFRRPLTAVEEMLLILNPSYFDV